MDSHEPILTNRIVTAKVVFFSCRNLFFSVDLCCIAIRNEMLVDFGFLS